MAIYTYTAQDEQGNKFSGTYQNVRSTAVLRAELAGIGCRLLHARRTRSGRGPRHRIHDKEVVGLVFQFAGMYNAGLSILHCLETLENQTKNASLRAVMADVRTRVETGSSLKAAFMEHKAVFGHFFIAMVEAGETGGKLGESLELSARYLENRAELRARVRAAFVYPLIVTCVALMVIGGLLLFVVPVFAKLYGRLNVPLPLPTQCLITLSGFIRVGWLPALVLGGGLYLWGRRLWGHPRVKRWLDRVKLRLPIFGALNQLVMVSRFIRTFATLSSVGVPLIEAIEVAQVVANNYYWTQITSKIKESVRVGNPMAQAMEAHEIFPAVIVRMADSGEQAGVLPAMLNKGADFLDKEIDRTVNSLLTKLEPVLTVILGGIIGLLLMSVYLPMFDYMNQMQ